MNKTFILLLSFSLTMQAYGETESIRNELAKSEALHANKNNQNNSKTAMPYYLIRQEKAALAILMKLYLGQEKLSDFELRALKQEVEQKQLKVALRVQVNSFEEFLQKMEADDILSKYNLSQISLNKLVALTIPEIYYSDSDRVERKIQDYYLQRNILMARKTMERNDLVVMSVGATAMIASGKKQELKLRIEQMYDQQIDAFISELGQKKSAQVIVMTKILKGYFKYLPKAHKIEIFYQLMQQPSNADKMDLFLTVIQNAGPQLQKLIQIMGRNEDIPQSFKEIFQKLESQVKPVSWPQVEKLLKENNIDPKSFVYFERKPIGVGTMAQTHRVQYLDENGVRQDSVMRFLKPGIAELLEMDHQILIRLTKELDQDPELKKYNLPSFSDLIEDVHKSVVEELDMAHTIKNQTAALKFYQKMQVAEYDAQKNWVRFNVPKAHFYKGNSNFMIQDLVFGNKPHKEFKAYKEIYPDLYKVISEKTAAMWLEEAFFGSGFFHADLHQGNMMVQVKDQEIVINILDYGMVGHLSQQVRENALKLVIAINIDNAEAIANSFLLLSKKESRSRIDAKDFENKVVQQLTKIKGRKVKLEEWTAWALEQGIELDYEFLKLNRGIAAVQGMLVDSKSLQTIESLGKKIAMKHAVYSGKLVLKDQDFKTSDYFGLVKSLTKSRQGTKLTCEGLFK